VAFAAPSNPAPPLSPTINNNTATNTHGSGCAQLFLCDDAFTGRLKTMIHPALGHLCLALTGSHLRVLDLSDNAVNPQGAERMSPMLSQCLTLKELYLNNTGVGPAGGRILGEALLAAVAEGRKAGVKYGLEVFVLGRSRLESEGGESLARALGAMGTLVEVRMFQNGIPPPAAATLARGLAMNANLEVVDLSDNRLKLQGGACRVP
jgi:Ran GTPase-activating protein 1